MIDINQTRRGFIKTLLKSAGGLLALWPFSRLVTASTTALDPRPGLPNPYVTPDGRPYLVSVSGDDFGRSLRTGLAALGGLGLLIDSNQDVLIKPNLVYTEEYPTTSDVNSIVATIQAVQQVSSGVITVGDGGSINNQQIYDYLGVEEPVNDAGANLVVFDETYLVRRTSWPEEMPDFEVWADIYDTPILINLCALKRHYAAFLTCAIKHHVGAMSGPNRTDTRSYLHDFDDQSNEFLTTLAEMAGLVNPELTIVDARQIMAINGPLRSYGGEIRDCNRIIICGDPVATDAYCAQLMQQHDETFNADWTLPTLQRAEELGLGTANLDNVEIIELEQTSIEDMAGPPVPDRYGILRNYPNPFNGSTTIRFQLPEKSSVRLEIYDMLGRRIARLADDVYSAGIHDVVFNANGLASGTYYIKLATPEHSLSRAMVLLK